MDIFCSRNVIGDCRRGGKTSNLERNRKGMAIYSVEVKRIFQGGSVGGVCGIFQDKWEIFRNGMLL